MSSFMSLMFLIALEREFHLFLYSENPALRKSFFDFHGWKSRDEPWSATRNSKNSIGRFQNAKQVFQFGFMMNERESSRPISCCPLRCWKLSRVTLPLGKCRRKSRLETGECQLNRDYLGVGEGHDDERNDKLHHRRDSAVNLSIVIRRPVDLTNVYRNNNNKG